MAIYFYDFLVSLFAKPDTDWRWTETSRGPVMERRRNGETETRPVTEAEMAEYMASRAGW